MCVVGFTAVAVLISSLSESQQPTGDTTIKLTKNGRIPARKRIEMRLEQAKDTKGQRNEPLRYPDWWEKAWKKSKVSMWDHRFVGDKPLFPPCTRERPLSKEGLYGFVEPREFLPNSKNPCWYERSGKSKEFKCAPYFYLAGVAKGGTTDIFARIRLHPDVMQGTQKEYHWWDRYRFGDPGEDETGPKGGSTSFDEYLEQITGPELKDVENDIITKGQSIKVFGDGSPSYLWDVDNWDLIDGNQECDEPRVVIGQHIRHFYPDAKILMTFRHPTPRLYSRFLSRIPRTPQLKNATAEDFHKYVVRGIQMYKDCFVKFSIRQCAYNDTLHTEAFVRLVEGMYPVFMADWFRIWPREQNLILRYDDYARDMKTSLRDIIEFLELTKLKISQVNKMVDHGFSNIGKMYDTIGPMLPKTEEEPREFLPNSKNPCWYERSGKSKEFKCAPYFYLAGVAKGGTTDMFVRIRLHPDVMQGTQKEYHWWDRYRFGDTEEDDDTGAKEEATSFDEYLQQITGPELKDVENDIITEGHSTKVFGDGSPSYLWDVENWNLIDGNQDCDEPRVVIGQHIRHFYPDAKIIMTFRHPTPRLYSRFLSRIPRTPQLKNATAEDFHKYVVRGIQMYKDCFEKFSIRQCAYNDTLHTEAFVRLVEGMYPVFLADWFRIWPREQNLIVRYDDYARDMKTSLRDIIKFLGLTKIKISDINKIVDHRFANIGKMYDTIGPMLPKTEEVLNKFYEPFILQFAEILV
nr:hypothetical protein BaRGS_026210 [Batillaria attramentaria]